MEEKPASQKQINTQQGPLSPKKQWPRSFSVYVGPPRPGNVPGLTPDLQSPFFEAFVGAVAHIQASRILVSFVLERNAVCHVSSRLLEPLDTSSSRSFSTGGHLISLLLMLGGHLPPDFEDQSKSGMQEPDDHSRGITDRNAEFSPRPIACLITAHSHGSRPQPCG